MTIFIFKYKLQYIVLKKKHMNIKRISSKLIALTAISFSLFSCANDDDSTEYNTTYPKIESRINNDSIMKINDTPDVRTFSKEKERPQACQGWNCLQFD